MSEKNGRKDAAAAIMAAEAARDDAIEQISLIRHSADYHKSQEAMRLHNELLARATCAEARVAELEAALREARNTAIAEAVAVANGWLIAFSDQDIGIDIVSPRQYAVDAVKDIADAIAALAAPATGGE